LNLEKYSEPEKRKILDQLTTDLLGVPLEHLRFAWNTWKFSLWNENEVPEIVNKPNKIISTLDKLWREIQVDIKNGKHTTARPLHADIIIGGMSPKLLRLKKDLNIITNSGLIEMAKRGTSEERVAAGTTHCAVGTGTNSAQLTDIILQTEIDRKEFDTEGDRGVSGKTERYGMSFSYANLGSVDRDITEAGLFNKSSGGDLIARVVGSAIPVTTGRVMGVQVDITHENGTEV
jgi:hypothetical protein